MENNPTRVVTHRKRVDINRIIAQWEQSGQRKSLFCREQKIKPSTFHGWFSRRKKHSAQKSLTKPGFIPIKLAQEDSKHNSFAKIKFPNGGSINLFQVVPCSYLRGLFK